MSTTATNVYLSLYVATLALHLILVGAVFAGAVAALAWRRDKALATSLRSWLPFWLGLAITAGVGPLLFGQVLYPEAMYTSHLLLWWRFGAFVPVLLVGFYLLYLGKRESGAESVRTVALVGSVLCLAFLANTWGESHLVSLHRAAWPSMYVDGVMPQWAALPRLVVFVGVSCLSLATCLLWLSEFRQRRRVATTGGIGGIVTLLGLFWCADDSLYDPVGVLGMPLLSIVSALTANWSLRRLSLLPEMVSRWLGTLGLAAGVLVLVLAREWVRLSAAEPKQLVLAHERAFDQPGMVLFFAFFVVNGAVIAWSVRRVRRALGSGRG